MEEDFPFYRITHIDNVPLLLRDGLWAMSADRRNEDYTFIADGGLTNKRADIAVPVPPGGTLADYIPFYFGPRLPMLYNIQHGYGVVQREAEEIVYLCLRRRVLDDRGLVWCFTDGHAKQDFTEFYTSSHDLSPVDVEAVGERFWASRRVMETDPDLRRRKQAELLIHHHVPPTSILHILTANEKSQRKVEQFVLDSGLVIGTSCASYDRFYY